MKNLIGMAFLLFSTLGMAQTKISGNVMPNVMKVGTEYLKMNG